MSARLLNRGCGLVAAIAALIVLCTSARVAPRLSEVRSWAFQLQNVDPLEIKLSPYDLVVIDYGFDRRNATAFPREVVDLMRTRPDGSKRLIFAYFSIGEAENYRYYWQESWLKTRPRLLPGEWGANRRSSALSTGSKPGLGIEFTNSRSFPSSQWPTSSRV